jgi:hypothetical protein
MAANGQDDTYGVDQCSSQQWLGTDEDMRRMSNQLFLDISKLLKETLFDTGKWKDALSANLRNLGKSVMDTSAQGIAKSIIPSLAGAIPIIGPFLQGFMRLLPFAEGGIVRGSNFGVPAIVGERYTDEMVMPLSQLGRMMNAPLPAAGNGGNVNVQLHLSGALIDTTHLQREVWRAAKAGQAADLARRVSTNITQGSGW